MTRLSIFLKIIINVSVVLKNLKKQQPRILGHIHTCCSSYNGCNLSGREPFAKAACMQNPIGSIVNAMEPTQFPQAGLRINMCRYCWCKFAHLLNDCDQAWTFSFMRAAIPSQSDTRISNEKSLEQHRHLRTCTVRERFANLWILLVLSLFRLSLSGRCCLDGSSIHQPIFGCLSHSPDTSTHPILHVLLTDLHGLPLFVWLPGSWVLLIRQNESDSERRPEIREIEEFSISYLPWGKLRRSFWLVIGHSRIGLLLIILSTSSTI